MATIHNPVRILLVEDNPPDAFLFAEAARRGGLNVEIDQCPDGEQFLQRIRGHKLRHRPDLCVIDLSLPKVNGLELLKVIRTVPPLERVPIMVLTSSRSPQDKQECLDLGANAFVTKPTGFDDFVNVVGSAIRSALVGEFALQRLAAIIESSQDAIISMSMDGVVQSWNSGATEIYGYTAEEMIGRQITVLLQKERIDEEAEIRRRVERGESVRHFETVRIRKDGHEIFVSLTVSPLVNGRGLTVGLSHIARDITSTKAAEEHMRQRQKLESLGILAGGVAHDFNNLLTGILGNASMLLDTGSIATEDQPFLLAILKAAERAAGLTRQLLAYAGKGRFVTAPVNLSELTAETSNLVENLIPPGAILQLDLCDDLPCIAADSGQLQQVIMNLIINAAEAIGDDRSGTVRIATSVRHIDESFLRTGWSRDDLVSGRYVALEVVDTGCGMSESVLSKIFDPFFSTKFAGRGLGLAAVLGIVQSHAGALKVSSIAGTGSTFELLFPAIEARPLARVAEPQSFEAQCSGAILVVDDEELIRDFARSALQASGYRVILATNGAEAVETVRAAPDEIALVLLDLKMPVMGGEEAFRELRTIRPALRVLLSSGFDEIAAIGSLTDDGLAGFLQKPYSVAQLTHKIRIALDSPTPGA